jgi:integrase
VVFTRDEMIALENLDLSSNPFHEKIRDQYLIYLWSGIRKSDLKNLISVINPHTNKFVFRTGKTGEISEIPAFDTLIKIAEKYKYNFPEPVHDTIVLKEIKEICKLIPTMNITVEKKYTKGGQNKRDLLQKYQRIVIHTARRSLATVLVENGLKHEQVMKITGHKKLLTLQRYVKSGTDIDQMLEIGKKIKNG